MINQNSRWQPMTQREIVGLFALPIKKYPDRKERAHERAKTIKIYHRRIGPSQVA